MQGIISNGAMIDDVVDWIKQQDFFLNSQALNYAVGITTSDNMIISKVAGVTTKTSGMSDLIAQIKKQDWWSTQIKGLYLAGTFGGDGGSNHGEMCVLAAADELGEELAEMGCTGDNCPACATMLSDAAVTTRNETAKGSQSGWIHPRGRMALGSQLNRDWAGQIDELKAFNKLDEDDRDDFKHKLTQRAGRDPKGKFQKVA